jgi:hypothetical protein
MDESITAIGFTPDIRISPKPAILALAIAGALVGAIGGVPRLTLVTLPVALLILALSGVAWALEGWRPRLGAAFSVFSLMVMALLARYWLGVGGALVLLALPPAFAAAVIGLPAGVLSAAGSTALLVALWQTGFSPTWGGGSALGGAALSEIGLARYCFLNLASAPVILGIGFDTLSHRRPSASSSCRTTAGWQMGSPCRGSSTPTAT